jgi:hypothetical protein
MAQRKQKSKASGTKDKQDITSDSHSPYNTFPLSRYASLLGSQTLGLGFTLGMLPRTRVLQPELAKLFGMQDDIPKSSQDHPQHPFFDPLTESPARTLLWLCVGSFILVAWSAGSLRLWHTANKNDQPDSPATPDAKAETEKTVLGTTIQLPATPAKLLVRDFSFSRMPPILTSPKGLEGFIDCDRMRIPSCIGPSFAIWGSP